MATITTITYAADSPLTVTAWGPTDLNTGLTATSAIFDNSSTNYVDTFVGGSITSDASGVAGDTFDIYVSGQYSDTATDMTGAIAALYGANNQEVVNTSFIRENLILLTSVSVEASTAQALHWGPVSIASAFGGTMPKYFMLALHVNGSQDSTDANVNVVGITYTHT